MVVEEADGRLRTAAGPGSGRLLQARLDLGEAAYCLVEPIVI
jgi:hypothetical protein